MITTNHHNYIHKNSNATFLHKCLVILKQSYSHLSLDYAHPYKFEALPAEKSIPACILLIKGHVADNC